MHVICGGGSTHAALLDRVESKDIRIICSPPLTNCLTSLKLPCNVASLAILMLTALIILLTACLLYSTVPDAQDFLLFLIPILSKSLMQEFTRIYSLSSLPLVNSVTAFLYLYFPLIMTWMLSRAECKETLYTPIDLLFRFPFYFNGSSGNRAFFSPFVLHLRCCHLLM